MIEEYSNFITIIKLDSTSFGKTGSIYNFMTSRQYVRIESYRNHTKHKVLKLFRNICNLLMSIVEDRRHVYVLSYSVKFDSSWGVIHPLILIDIYSFITSYSGVAGYRLGLVYYYTLISVGFTLCA
jgi:hypothetical protein